MAKQRILSGVLVGVIYLACTLFLVRSHELGRASKAVSLNDQQKLGMQMDLNSEGKKLFREGRYEEAMAQFQAANNPELWLYVGGSDGYAEAYIRRIYFMRGEFEKALAHISAVVQEHPDHQPFVEEKREYEAILASLASGNWELVYEHIAYLKEQHKTTLPPEGYNFGSASTISTLLRLYDTIGDHDAGIGFVDEILEWGYSRDEKYVRVKTAEEALERGYKTAAEYLKVREAFEADKAEGTKGRATQVLIQSDYFPW